MQSTVSIANAEHQGGLRRILNLDQSQRVDAVLLIAICRLSFTQPLSWPSICEDRLGTGR